MKCCKHGYWPEKCPDQDCRIQDHAGEEIRFRGQIAALEKDLALTKAELTLQTRGWQAYCDRIREAMCADDSVPDGNLPQAVAALHKDLNKSEACLSAGLAEIDRYTHLWDVPADTFAARMRRALKGETV